MMMRMVTSIALLLSIAACTSTPILDPKYVRPWSNEISNEEPNDRSAIAVLKKGRYELYYLASRHTNILSDDTLVLVKKLFDEYQFNAVLIESIPHSSGESPKWFVEEAKRGMKDNFIATGESGLSAIYASNKMIPFFAGEPDHKNIYDYLKSKEYSDIDVIGFYTIRQIPQWIRQKENPIGLFERKIPPFAANYCKIFEITKCPNLAEIKQWYKSNNGRDLKANISNEETAPVSDSKVFTQGISAAVGHLRDRYTLKVIQNMLIKYKRVAVVYGASHFTTLRKSFERHFGSPLFIYDDRSIQEQL